MNTFLYQDPDPAQAERYLAHLLELPILERETREMRRDAVQAAAANLPKEERLKAVSMVHRIWEIDQDRDVMRATGRPGILVEFAKMHPWMWRKVEQGRRVRFSSVAHDLLSAARFYAWLIHEIGSRGDQAAKALIKRQTLALKKPLRSHVPKPVLDSFEYHRSPWFVHQNNPKMPPAEASKLICTYLDKNRSRHLSRIRAEREAFISEIWATHSQDPYPLQAGSSWERLFQTHGSP